MLLLLLLGRRNIASEAPILTRLWARRCPIRGPALSPAPLRLLRSETARRAAAEAVAAAGSRLVVVQHRTSTSATTSSQATGRAAGAATGREALRTTGRMVAAVEGTKVPTAWTCALPVGKTTYTSSMRATPWMVRITHFDSFD